MNWFQKITAQFKQMPFLMKPPNDDEYTSGYYDLHKNMSPETKKQELAKFDNLDWCGAGRCGVALDCGPNVVCKYVRDYQEAGVATKMMENKYPGLAKVYDVQLVQEDPEIYLIMAEKCRTLNNIEKEIITTLYGASVPIRRYNFWSPDAIARRYPHYSRQLINKLHQDYLKLVKNMDAARLDIRDLHEDNIGYNSNGELVLIDFGQTT